MYECICVDIDLYICLAEPCNPKYGTTYLRFEFSRRVPVRFRDRRKHKQNNNNNSVNNQQSSRALQTYETLIALHLASAIPLAVQYECLGWWAFLAG